MKRLITSLFVLSICFVQAQSFDHIVYKQQVNPIYLSAIKDGKYQQSLEELEAIKKKYGFLYCEEYLLQSYCYKMMGNNLLTAQSLKMAWSSRSFDMRTLWFVNQLQPGKLMEGFNEAENQLVNEGFENGSKIRPANADSLIRVFQIIAEEDRIISDNWVMNQENKQAKAEYDDMFRRHEAFLEDYVRKNGYPGEKQLQLMDMEVWVILVHAAGNEDFYQRMKPVFMNEVRKGNMSPMHFANFVDQHQFYNNLPTVYQSLVHDNKTELTTKEEQKQITKNRFEIGLVNLEFTHSTF